MSTKRDLEKAWAMVEMCVNDPTRGFREAIAEEIALLLAELRGLRKDRR